MKCSRGKMLKEMVFSTKMRCIMLWSNSLVIIPSSKPLMISRKQLLITSNKTLLHCIKLLLEITKEMILKKPKPHGSKVSFMRFLRKTGKFTMMIRVAIWTPKNLTNFSKAWSQSPTSNTQALKSFSSWKIRTEMVPSTSKNWEIGCANLHLLKNQKTSMPLRIPSILTLKIWLSGSTPPQTVFSWENPMRIV